jgi:transcriptional regulator with XRE-family HTH domain
MPLQGPTVVRRQLGRRLREAAGKTEKDLVEANLLSRAKLHRIETGRSPVKVPDVQALCWMYGADEATVKALSALAVGTNGQGWHEDYSDVAPGWFSLYLGLEGAATELCTYDPELIHGLLQTPAYVRALYEAGDVDNDEEAIQRQINLRQERQPVVTSRVPPLRLTAILSPGALARSVGGANVLAEQTQRLQEMNGRDNVNIRVLPWAVGAHAAMVSPFTILDFDDPNDPAVVYLENQTSARYLEKPEELAEYRRIFDSIAKKSVSIEEFSSDNPGVEEVKQVRQQRRPVRRDSQP